jgi:hypothetical protein
MRFKEDGQAVLVGGSEDRLDQTKHLVVVFQSPAGMNGETAVAALSVLYGDRVGVGRGVNTVESAVGKWRASHRRIVRRELHSFEAVFHQALVAGYTFEAGPNGTSTELDEIVEIEIDAELWRSDGTVVEETRYEHR